MNTTKMGQSALAQAVSKAAGKQESRPTLGEDRGILSFEIFGVPAMQAVMQIGLGAVAVIWLGQGLGMLDPVIQLAAMAGLFAAGSFLGYHLYRLIGVHIEDFVNIILPFEFW